MKIIFPVIENRKWASILDERFGRAHAFILYDEETNNLSWAQISEQRILRIDHGIQTSVYLVVQTFV